jgi:hypothetical protein
MSIVEEYIEAELRKPEYQHIMVRLKMLEGILYRSKKNHERSISHKFAIAEIDNIITELHDIDQKVRRLDDMLARNYFYEWIDDLIAECRSRDDDLRWSQLYQASPQPEIPENQLVGQ